jgi:Phosphotransferase enzyme family
MTYLPRPANFDPRIGQEEAALVLGEYTSANWRRIDRLRQGARSVGDDENAGTARKLFLRYDNRDFLLKQVPWYSDCPVHVRAVMQLQACLADQAGPVAPIERTRNGELVCSLPFAGESRRYTLQRLMPGTTWDGTAAGCAETGRALAAIHVLTAELLPDATLAHIDRHDVFAIARAAVALTGVAWHTDGEILRPFAMMIDQFEAAALDVGYPDCVRAIHGDVNPTNTIFGAGGTVTAFIDFDNCCRDHPAHDVARGLVHFGCFPTAPGANRFVGLTGRFRHDAGVAFLAGYRPGARDWTQIAAVLPSVSGCLAIELCVLALLNGWFGATEIPHMAKLPFSVVDWTKALLAEVAG